MFSKRENDLERMIGEIKEEIKTIKEIIESNNNSLGKKVERLVELWEPSPNEKNNNVVVEKEQKEGMTLIEFSKKYDLNIDRVKAGFKALRLSNEITQDMYKMGHNGKRKRFLIGNKAEEILLDFMNNKSAKVIVKPKKKKLTDMTREELIKEIYRKNQIIKRK